MIDALHLSQVLSNLLSNAMKYSEKGTIEVRCRFAEDEDDADYDSSFSSSERDLESSSPSNSPSLSFARSLLASSLTEDLASSRRRKVEVMVKDSGIGLTSAQLEKVFLPFVQLHDEDGELGPGQGAGGVIGGGVGLGLSITKALVKAMGGRIRVESIYGEGSAFTVILPLSPSSPEEYLAERRAQLGAGASPTLVRVASGRSTPRNSKTMSLLVVDDNRTNLVPLEIYFGHGTASRFSGRNESDAPKTRPHGRISSFGRGGTHPPRTGRE